MIARFKSSGCVLFGLVLALSAWGQSSTDQNPTTDQTKVQEQKQKPGPVKEIGTGAGNIGIGVAEGTGDLAKGTARGVGDLATLHPLDAGASIGKSAAVAGKDVTVGAAKGTGKITKGIGRAFKKLF